MRQEGIDDNRYNVAVIDIGSNTFHLLIVTYHSGSQSFEEIYRERKFVYLAKDGIAYLSEETIARGLVAFKELIEQCLQYGISLHNIKAIGTAALRSAENAQSFIDRAILECGVKIDVISGHREAELIYKGILHSRIDMEDLSLIIDIGGGLSLIHI